MGEWLRKMENNQDTEMMEFGKNNNKNNVLK